MVTWLLPLAAAALSPSSLRLCQHLGVPKIPGYLLVRGFLAAGCYPSRAAKKGMSISCRERPPWRPMRWFSLSAHQR